MRIKQWHILLYALIFPFFGFNQRLEKMGKFDKNLSEVSGLVKFNDTLFVCHNDSGNEAKLYLINHKAEVVHEIQVTGATNRDWEDIAQDTKGNLYIADIGNNMNNRKDLCIYVVSKDSMLLRKSVEAKKIAFTYPDQQAFPPEISQQNFDSEALAYHNGLLYIFSKCRTKPYTGRTVVYTLNFGETTQVAQKVGEIQMRKRGFYRDASTAAAFYEGTCYILTYSGIEMYRVHEQRFTYMKRIPFRLWSQKEALAVDQQNIFIADEKTGPFGRKLYQIKQHATGK